MVPAARLPVTSPPPIFRITLAKTNKKTQKKTSLLVKNNKKKQKKTQSVDGEQQRQYAALDAQYPGGQLHTSP
jgi:hypothetical protein